MKTGKPVAGVACLLAAVTILWGSAVPAAWACRSTIIFTGPTTKTGTVEGNGPMAGGREALIGESDGDTGGLGRDSEDLQADVREVQVRRQQRVTIAISSEHIRSMKISCTSTPVLRPRNIRLTRTCGG